MKLLSRNGELLVQDDYGYVHESWCPFGRPDGPDDVCKDCDCFDKQLVESADESLPPVYAKP